jgi:hypothetical protein
MDRYDGDRSCGGVIGMWESIDTAPPFNRDVELAVVDKEGIRALVFPCRRIVGGWMNSHTKVRIDVSPTHWREWK